LDIKVIQRALKERGFDPGPIDGAYGVLSWAAMTAFQRAAKLSPTGKIDAASLSVLLPGAPPVVRPPWLLEAERLKGLREGAGRADNPTIMGWARRLKQAVFRADSTAWCGLFVGHCMSFAVPGEPIPSNPLGARNWLAYGRPVSRPAPGAVLVFWRGKKAGWQGHVGFYVGEDAEAYHVLGGNQSDAVTVARLGRDRLLGVRWPATVPLPASLGPVIAHGTGKLSTNEA
jgi:uncharacterized protein (TIGR02594 family)